LLSVEQLFTQARLDPGGNTTWGQSVVEHGPGVYVISIADPSSVKLDSLPEHERQHWNPQESIIYIGRSARLSRRLRQFYKHKYGEKSPHRGGQAILCLHCEKHIHFAAVKDYAGAERRLLEIFEKESGRKPFGNRARSARLSRNQTDTAPVAIPR
jgi:hypothetical protein